LIFLLTLNQEEKREEVDLEAKDAVKEDLNLYSEKGGIIKYPFPLEDFALRTFNLDIQYEDFTIIFDDTSYDPKELYGCLFPDGKFFQGIDKVILINTNRSPFYLGGKEIKKEYYSDYSERQTIAHEIGHYSDRFLRNVNKQPSLFGNTISADTPSSVIVYPKNEETFANKYSRELLMPDDRVIEFIQKKELSGTFDLNIIIDEIKKLFGVTQFMIEIRLHEMGIHFLNGIYIKNINKYKYQKYTVDDLLVLIDVAKEYGLRHPYYDAQNFVKAYNLATGETRASGALVMTLWRIMKGRYDKYPEVFEKRVTDLVDVDINYFKEEKNA
jgi:hypothetical protein